MQLVVIAGSTHLAVSEWAYQSFKVSCDLPPSGRVIELDN